MSVSGSDKSLVQMRAMGREDVFRPAQPTKKRKARIEQEWPNDECGRDGRHDLLGDLHARRRVEAHPAVTEGGDESSEAADVKRHAEHGSDELDRVRLPLGGRSVVRAMMGP